MVYYNKLNKDGVIYGFIFWDIVNYYWKDY